MSLNLLKVTKASILFVVVVLIFTESASSQACGYIFAKFQILNAKGEIVEDAKLQLLGRDTNESILFSNNELSFSKTEHAFKLHHGICSSHYGTRLVISHSDYEGFDSQVDLPLNTLSTEHVFIAKLKRNGSRDEASLLLQSVSQFCMSVLDELGATIPDPIVKLSPTKRQRTQANYIFTGNSDGQIDVTIADGVYHIKVEAETYHKRILKMQTLPPDPRSCMTIKLRTRIPSHQIT